MYFFKTDIVRLKTTTVIIDKVMPIVSTALHFQTTSLRPYLERDLILFFFLLEFNLLTFSITPSAHPAK